MMSNENERDARTGSSTSSLFQLLTATEAAVLTDQEPPIIVKPGRPTVVGAAGATSLQIGFRNIIENLFDPPTTEDDGAGGKFFVYRLKQAGQRLTTVVVIIPEVGATLFNVPKGSDFAIFFGLGPDV